MLTVNAPVAHRFWCRRNVNSTLEGLSQLMRTVDAVRAGLNGELRM